MSRIPVPLLLALSLACAPPLPAETARIAGETGELTLEIRLPPQFQQGTAYSVLVSPGDYYWQNLPAQPGWIVVTSDAFYGPGRVANSQRALTWLRERYTVQHGGFHIAGWSANSAGVFEIAMASPRDFLSVTGVAGMPGPGAEGDLAKLADVRVQFIVGENDRYWRQGSERWHDRLQAKGVRSTLEIIPKGEHVMPEIAGAPFFERMDRLVGEIESAES